MRQRGSIHKGERILSNSRYETSLILHIRIFLRDKGAIESSRILLHLLRYQLQINSLILALYTWLLYIRPYFSSTIRLYNHLPGTSTSESTATMSENDSPAQRKGKRKTTGSGTNQNVGNRPKQRDCTRWGSMNHPSRFLLDMNMTDSTVISRPWKSTSTRNNRLCCRSYGCASTLGKHRVVIRGHCHRGRN